MQEALEYVKRVREKRPLVHCITNPVTVNDCANMLLAAGASPTMAQHLMEVEEISAGCDALVCNLGATSAFEAMRKAVSAAAVAGNPIIIDPVGAGGSSFRRDFFETLVKVAKPACIRGNFSEIQALAWKEKTVTGVDAGQNSLSLVEKDRLVAELAERLGCVVIASGAVDIVSDGRELVHNGRGDCWMTAITGTGCMSSALLGAYFACGKEPLQSAGAVCRVMGICGERAANKARARGEGTMSFRQYFIDEMSLL